MVKCAWSGSQQHSCTCPCIMDLEQVARAALQGTSLSGASAGTGGLGTSFPLLEIQYLRVT